DEFEALYSHLLRDRLINSADEQHLRMAFDQTKRGHINLCPGVEMKYVLPIESAKQMERESMLKDVVRRIVNDAISICN
ncbi:MAG TPA: hypothetical protein DDW87_00270, partial [Firmicutes bacterium]|nr:hypothetical protein [Bacillota bacterium]